MQKCEFAGEFLAVKRQYGRIGRGTVTGTWATSGGV